MKTKNRQRFETGLFFATIIILIWNITAFFGSAHIIALGVLNSIILAGFVIIFAIDLLNH